MNSVGDTTWIADARFGAWLFAVRRGATGAISGTCRVLTNGWSAGYGGAMGYLADPRRRDPARVLAGARSVIVCALNYNTAHPYSTEAAACDGGDEPRGWISRYAWGRDYHEVLWERLNTLSAATEGTVFPEAHESRAYADTGPVAERLFAKYAGLGWLGKNTLLLNENMGSWFFLGVIFTTLELSASLAPYEMPPADLCGNCRQCLDACPTGAFVEPYVLDARRCISYLTIELRGGVPEEFREAIGNKVYGCDICQEVCPYNREAAVTTISDFEPRSWANVEVRTERSSSGAKAQSCSGLNVGAKAPTPRRNEYSPGGIAIATAFGVAGGNERGGISRKVSRQRDEADEVERIGEERMHCAGKQQGTAGHSPTCTRLGIAAEDSRNPRKSASRNLPDGRFSRIQ